MTLIIKNRAVVEDDFTVVRAAEDGALPAVDALPAGKVIVPFALWKEHKSAIVASRPKEDIGVWLAPDFGQLSVIAVDFPVFRDGRGFSIGRLLRERYQWTGELRAIGDVLRDQVLFHSRCGFDAFAVRADKDINDALNAFNEFTELYQGATDNLEPLFRRRAALVAALGA